MRSNFCFLICLTSVIVLLGSCLKNNIPTSETASMTIGPPEEISSEVTSTRLRSISEKQGCEINDVMGSNQASTDSTINLRVDCFPYVFKFTVWKNNDTSDEDYWYEGSQPVSEDEARNSGGNLNVKITLNANPKKKDKNDPSTVEAESKTVKTTITTSIEDDKTINTYFFQDRCTQITNYGSSGGGEYAYDCNQNIIQDITPYCSKVDKGSYTEGEQYTTTLCFSMQAGTWNTKGYKIIYRKYNSEGGGVTLYNCNTDILYNCPWKK